MKITPLHWVAWAWLALAAYWVIAGWGAQRAQKAEALGERLAHILLMAAAFVLLYSPDPRFGALNRRFEPASAWVVAVLGAALTSAGIALALWARSCIGRYWSARVSIVAGHELIRSGPYARIRHPIYSGLLLALVGTALAIGEYRALAALGIAAFGFWRKAKKEEAYLAREFGPAFEEHRRRTGFFLPRIS